MMSYIVDRPSIHFLDVAAPFLTIMRNRLPVRLKGPGRRHHRYVEPATRRDNQFHFKSATDEQHVKQLLSEMNRELVAVSSM